MGRCDEIPRIARPPPVWPATAAPPARPSPPSVPPWNDVHGIQYLWLDERGFPPVIRVDTPPVHPSPLLPPPVPPPGVTERAATCATLAAPCRRLPLRIIHRIFARPCRVVGAARCSDRQQGSTYAADARRASGKTAAPVGQRSGPRGHAHTPLNGSFRASPAPSLLYSTVQCPPRAPPTCRVIIRVVPLCGWRYWPVSVGRVSRRDASPWGGRAPRSRAGRQIPPTPPPHPPTHTHPPRLLTWFGRAASPPPPFEWCRRAASPSEGTSPLDLGMASPLRPPSPTTPMGVSHQPPDRRDRPGCTRRPRRVDLCMYKTRLARGGAEGDAVPFLFCPPPGRPGIPPSRATLSGRPADERPHANSVCWGGPSRKGTAKGGARQRDRPRPRGVALSVGGRVVRRTDHHRRWQPPASCRCVCPPPIIHCSARLAPPSSLLGRGGGSPTLFGGGARLALPRGRRHRRRPRRGTVLVKGVGAPGP